MQRACSQKCAAYVARHCLQAVDRFQCAQEAFLLVFHQKYMYIAYTRCKHAAKIALHILLGTVCRQSTDFSSHKKRFFLFFTKKYMYIAYTACDNTQGAGKYPRTLQIPSTDAEAPESPKLLQSPIFTSNFTSALPKSCPF